MTTITFNIGCRNCLQSDGIRHSYQIKDDEQNQLHIKTEYEIMQMVEQRCAEGNYQCVFCRSTNLEILQVEVNGRLLYNYDQIIKRCEQRGEEMFQLNVDKKDSEIFLRVGGSEFVDPDVLRLAIKTIVETINERPDKQFNSKPSGNFFVCITGAVSFPQLKPYLRIETFRSVGITKHELITAMKPAAERIGVVI